MEFRVGYSEAPLPDKAMPRLLPKEYDALHRKKQVTIGLISLLPLCVCVALAFTWLNTAAIAIGITTTLLILWTVWVTPRPWTTYDQFIFVVWPVLLFSYIALWTLVRDIHGNILQGWGMAPIIGLTLGRFLFDGSNYKKQAAERQGLYSIVLIFALLIAFLSSTTGGSDPMHSALMNWFHLSTHAADVATIAIRKTIHFTFYGLAGYLAFRYVIGSRTTLSLNESWKKNPPNFKLGLQMALPFVAILAAYDETRQLFSYNRTGSFLDFLLDMSGALFFIWFLGGKWYQKLIRE